MNLPGNKDNMGTLFATEKKYFHDNMTIESLS